MTRKSRKRRIFDNNNNNNIIINNNNNNEIPSSSSVQRRISTIKNEMDYNKMVGYYSTSEHENICHEIENSRDSFMKHFESKYGFVKEKKPRNSEKFKSMKNEKKR